ncbi:hypothetical protein JCM11251_004621 [Rhodosporidiobolus azoricus]
MTAVSRPPIITSDSCYSPISPLSSPSSHPPTPAHLLPSRPSSPMSTQSSPQAQQRNHQRTADRQPETGDGEAAPPQSTHKRKFSGLTMPPPQRPARPVRLATPGTGYPFPVMLSRQNSLASNKSGSGGGGGGGGGPPARQLSEKTLARRAVMNANDGWGTPASSGATSSEDSAPGLSSAFSDSDRSSSSSCSTPVDDDGSAVTHSPTFPFGGDSGSRGKSPLSAPHFPPRTPDEVAHSRAKHAGSTPGAPPPAPLVKLEGAQPSTSSTDLHDVKKGSEGAEVNGASWDEIERAEEEAEKTPPSLAPTPPPPKANPLTKGFAGLRMSESSEGKEKRETGVGSKWEVD